jgi:hypothetical protein
MEGSMEILFVLLVLSCLLLIPSIQLGVPSVYPTGTTIYHPDKCWSSYIILSSESKDGVVLMDMNGNEVRVWKVTGCGPNRILPGGYLVTSSSSYEGGPLDTRDMVQFNWDGEIVWKFEKWEEVEEMKAVPNPEKGMPQMVPTGSKIWVARQHHDWQREGNPVGYYTPGMDPMVDKGKTLILGHTASRNPKINANELLDDVLYEVSWEGEVIWKWVFSEHFDEMGFSEAAQTAMKGMKAPRFDWLHINCASYLGPNKWYDEGDERFHPENIIWDSRSANLLGITDRKTGKIVWRVGPDYDTSPQLRELGWIIGVHHTHMIPRGLPGEGNIICYDNGGSAGYGPPNPMTSGIGFGSAFNCRRDHSRVLEFNPITLEKVWEYSAQALGRFMNENFREYSPYVSSAQRLPNGNTLITEGAMGRLYQVTPDLEIVWEYISPYYFKMKGPPMAPPVKQLSHMIYRAYGIPYEWIPQLDKPEERAVVPPHNSEFRIEPQ